jgi:type I restriction enzyme M protein
MRSRLDCHREEIEAKNYDLKALNLHTKTKEDTRTPQELLEFIQLKEREVQEALAALQVGSTSRRV